MRLLRGAPSFIKKFITSINLKRLQIIRSDSSISLTICLNVFSKKIQIQRAFHLFSILPRRSSHRYQQNLIIKYKLSKSWTITSFSWNKMD